ncbi:small acid-soluble spore protein P [Oceanobacillus luteolus]|uniref:Small, acid-soluble spore protein P n=1 Tax=Oceanobacillus luteolus TaxID=1274358 RepID=A0ABW4HW98_9BACI
MAPRPKGPKQKKNPDIPQSPDQPYGEPMQGSKKVKTRNHSRQNRNPGHGL